MSGIYTRPLYDECNNSEQVAISIGPGEWIQQTIQDNPNMCYHNEGVRNTRFMNSSQINIKYKNAIDIESSLKGLDIPISRCMQPNTLTERDVKLNAIYNNIDKQTTPTCSNFLTNSYTRLEPPAHISEQPYNRYEYPIIDPSQWVYYGFQDYNTTSNTRDGRSSRYDIKNKLNPENKLLRTQSNKLGNIQSFNSRQ